MPRVLTCVGYLFSQALTAGAESCNPSATPGELWGEVLETLRSREVLKQDQRWRLDPDTARHIKYRGTLVEWILEVCTDFAFGPTTADLAVQYMVRLATTFNFS
jgi:hypothetical protein